MRSGTWLRLWLVMPGAGVDRAELVGGRLGSLVGPPRKDDEDEGRWKLESLPLLNC